MDGMEEFEAQMEPYGSTPWAVPEAVQSMSIAALRPWALRVLFHILRDDDLPARLRLDAVKIVVDKTKDSDTAGMTGEDVDAEVRKLLEELERRG